MKKEIVVLAVVVLLIFASTINVFEGNLNLTTVLINSDKPQIIYKL